MIRQDDTVQVGVIGFGYATRTFHAPLIAATPGLCDALQTPSAPPIQALGVMAVIDAAARSSSFRSGRQKTDAVNITSAWLQALWKAASAAVASAVLPCTFSAAERPKSAQPLFGLRRRSSRKTRSASGGLPAWSRAAPSA